MTEIEGKSILVRVSARFELSGVDCILHFLDISPACSSQRLICEIKMSQGRELELDRWHALITDDHGSAP